MASDDDPQLPAILADLRDLSQWLDVRGQIQRLTALIVEALRLTAYGPTGDPVWLRDTARTFTAVGTDAELRTATLRSFSYQVLPDTWDGLAATTAKDAATALAGQAATVDPAMDDARAALTYLAGELEGAQADHLAGTALVQQAADKVEDADIGLFGVDLPIPNPMKIYDAITDAVAGIEKCVAAHGRAEDAAVLTVGRLAGVTAQARVAAAGRNHHLHPLDAVVLANATTGLPAGPGSHSAVLTPDQLDRAAAALTAMTPADREAFTGLLAAAGSDDERAWLFKTLAAGHRLAAITPFAEAIRGRGDDWLEAHLALVRPGDYTGSGRVGVFFGGVEVDQTDQTTCGPTTLVVARAMLDPLYAFGLTTGGRPDDPSTTSPAAFDQRLTDAELAAHHAVTSEDLPAPFPGDYSLPTWPQALGSPPWNMADWLNDNTADATGGNYDWRLVDSTDGDNVTSAVDDLRRNAYAGIPTVLMTGDSIPRHYVLVIGHQDGQYQIYNPSGYIATVSEQALLDGGPALTTAASWPNLHGVIAPGK